jgi:hypothetical protein
VDRRPLSALLALGLIGAVPSGAMASSADRLFAGNPSGTLSDSPSADLLAQASSGTLSDTPKAPGAATSAGGSSDTSGSGSETTPTAASLPFTGSDPRITLMLGFAAVLLGAGLRMRTGDARDFGRSLRCGAADRSRRCR